MSETLKDISPADLGITVAETPRTKTPFDLGDKEWEDTPDFPGPNPFDSCLTDEDYAAVEEALNDMYPPPPPGE